MPPHPHSHWRDYQGWKSLGLELSTTSNEACKLYDATLTQIVNHYDDPAVGGAGSCMDKMLAADPEFVMGKVVAMLMSGKSAHTDCVHAKEIHDLRALAQKPHVKPWERKHVEAVRYHSLGEIDAASAVWEDILLENPLDMLSLKMLTDAYIITGYSDRLRDSVGRILPHWTPAIPLYSNLLGMHAFGLEETNFYSEAEKQAKKALELYRGDAWAAHAVSHVREMTGCAREGIEFMSSTENDWADTHLSCHNYWHWSLYYFENGDFETTLGMLDDHVLPQLKTSGSTFNLTDAAALLRRLEHEGVDVGQRWNDVFEVGQGHLEDHIWSFTDLNVLMSCLGAGKTDVAKRMIDNMRDFVRNGYGDVSRIYRDVTIQMSEAFQAYDEGDYGRAVDLLKPIRYEIIKIGGSHAQRDVFHLFLIHAAMRSDRPEHQRLARYLLLERKSMKKESPMVERLLSKLVVAHSN